MHVVDSPSPLDNLRALHEIDTVLKIISTLVISSNDWKLLAVLSRDDLFRLVHQNSPELIEHLPAILKLCEWITLNTTDLLQAEKSTLFNFCQMPIDQLPTPKAKQDLLINMMKLMDSSSSLYNPH